MGTPEPTPVDEDAFHKKIVTGLMLLVASGVALWVMLAVVLIRADEAVLHGKICSNPRAVRADDWDKSESLHRQQRQSRGDGFMERCAGLL